MSLLSGKTRSNRKRAFSGLAPLALVVCAISLATEVPQKQQSNDGPHASDGTQILGDAL